MPSVRVLEGVASAALVLAIGSCRGATTDSRTVALLAEPDTVAQVLLARHGALLDSFQGTGSAAEVIAMDAHGFGFGVLDGTIGSDSTAISLAELVRTDPEVDYWQLISVRVVAFASVPPRFVDAPLGGMSSGPNTLSTLQGYPIVVHWDQRDNKWLATSIQVYPSGVFADSLRALLSGPRS